jgi:hypothetical protein
MDNWIYKSRHNDSKAISGIICFFCIIGIFAIVLFCCCETWVNNNQQAIIENNLKSCPKSSVVYFTEEEPFVRYKGRKVRIMTETCYQDYSWIWSV